MSFDQFYKAVIKNTVNDESVVRAVAYCDYMTNDNEYDGILRCAKFPPLGKSVIFVNFRFTSGCHMLPRPDTLFVFGAKERFIGDKNFEEIIAPLMVQKTRVIYLD